MYTVHTTNETWILVILKIASPPPPLTPRPPTHWLSSLVCRCSTPRETIFTTTPQLASCTLAHLLPPRTCLTYIPLTFCLRLTEHLPHPPASHCVPQRCWVCFFFNGPYHLLHSTLLLFFKNPSWFIMHSIIFMFSVVSCDEDHTKACYFRNLRLREL